MLRSISIVRAILLPVMSAVAVAALPTGPAFATLGSYPVALQECNFSHLDQTGPTSIRLFLKPDRMYSHFLLARAANTQDITREVVGGAGVVARLGDKISFHYEGAVPRCTMTVKMAKGRIGVELQRKDQSSWPPDIFFLASQ
jgi:hypothetical protein